MRNRAFRGCLIVLLVFVVADARPQSNPPSPSPAEIQKPEQPKAGEAKAPAQPDQNNSQAPAFGIKQEPSKSAQYEPAENPKDTDEKASADWWMVKLTAILAAIGALQLVIFGLQARRLRQTIDTMKELGKQQSADMQASIAVAKEAADAAKYSADAAMKIELPAIELAQFMLLRVTSLIDVSGVKFESGTNLPEFCGLVVNFTNSGRTNAQIFEQCVEWRVCKDLASIPEYTHQTHFPATANYRYAAAMRRRKSRRLIL